MYAHRGIAGRIGILSPVIMVWGIIGGLGYVYITSFIGHYWESNPLMVILLSIPYYFVYINIWAHLTMCMLVESGKVSKRWSDEHIMQVKLITPEARNKFMRKHIGEDRFEEFMYQQETLSNSEKYSFCKICNLVKPRRTHHCALCDRCVLKLDHHCPWVGNCVGFYNHKFFLMFCVAACIGCGMEFLYFTPRFISIIKNHELNKDGSISVMLGFVAGLSMSFALGIMSLIHAALIISNNTTIEAHISGGGRKNPYCFSKLENWRMAFGEDPWWRCILPLRPRVILTNPHEYPIRSEFENVRSRVEDPEEGGGGSGHSEEGIVVSQGENNQYEQIPAMRIKGSINEGSFDV